MLPTCEASLLPVPAPGAGAAQARTRLGSALGQHPVAGRARGAPAGDARDHPPSARIGTAPAPGRAAGLGESDLIAAVAATGLDGEAIRNVRLLEQFVLFEVPSGEAVRVAGSVDCTDVRGHTLRLELAKG